MNAGLLISGGAFQVTGISFAAFGIHKLRKSWTKLPGLYGRSKKLMKTTHRAVGSFLRRVFHRRQQTVPAYFSGTVSGEFGVSGTATVTRVPRPEPVNEQLEWFAGRLGDLTLEVENLQADFLDSKGRLEQVDRQTKAEFVRIDQDFRSSLTELAAGGLQIQTWGVLFLIIGTMLSVWGSLAR
jgi:hypothetical protein